MYYIDGKGHNLKLNSSRNYSYLTYHTGSKSHIWLFMASGVDTHTQTYRHPYKSDFRKPGVAGHTWFELKLKN